MATVGRWAPPVALMALIFFLSHQEGLSTNLGLIDVIGRKIAHMVEYGLLWFLLWRAFGYRMAGAAAAVAVLYAISDEYHQSFVESRQGTPVDVLIDSIGIALANLAARRWGPRASRAR